MADDTQQGNQDGRRGGIGQQIFDEVQKMVADESVTHSEAFRRISERTGRRAGTVAANYYRIARMQGVTRPRRGPGRPRVRRPAGGGDVAAALARVSAAIDDLTQAVRRQEQEISRIRAENEKLDEIRRLARRVAK